ncbi:hypothetical protein PMAYCL1PPCAC_14182, partial [Pristionchus mayeri]
RMGRIGIVYGPMSHFLYKFLDSRKFVGSPWVIVGKKIFWDTLATPPFSAMVIIGKRCIGSEPRTNSNNGCWVTSDTWQLDVSLWPPMQVINFAFVPAYLRVFFCNCVTLLYNIGL